MYLYKDCYRTGPLYESIPQFRTEWQEFKGFAGSIGMGLRGTSSNEHGARRSLACWHEKAVRGGRR